jgi:hypothetical protein
MDGGRLSGRRCDTQEMEVGDCNLLYTDRTVIILLQPKYMIQEITPFFLSTDEQLTVQRPEVLLSLPRISCLGMTTRPNCPG